MCFPTISAVPSDVLIVALYVPINRLSLLNWAIPIPGVGFWKPSITVRPLAVLWSPRANANFDGFVIVLSVMVMTFPAYGVMGAPLLYGTRA